MSTYRAYDTIIGELNNIIYKTSTSCKNKLVTVSYRNNTKRITYKQKITYNYYDETNVNYVINMCKYYLTYINIQLLVNKNVMFYQTLNYKNILVKVSKYDNTILNNMIYILNDGTDKQKFNFAVDLLETSERTCTSISNLFLLLVTKRPLIFNKQIYNKADCIKDKYGINYNKEERTDEKSEIRHKTQENKADSINVSIYNIQKQNNDNNIIKQDGLYYIKRDKFNARYKRIYKCIHIIQNLDITIMSDISDNKIMTQRYVLTENDCNWLGIQYHDNLQVFSTKLNWIEYDKD